MHLGVFAFSHYKAALTPMEHYLVLIAAACLFTLLCSWQALRVSSTWSAQRVGWEPLWRADQRLRPTQTRGTTLVLYPVNYLRMQSLWISNKRWKNVRMSERGTRLNCHIKVSATLS